MTIWAKDVDGALQYAGADEFRGIPNWRTHETACRGKGYFPLIGEAEEREGYTADPATWHTEQRSATRKELRREDPITHEPFMEPIYEEDPETHEMKKVGERQVEREVDIVLDKSYIQIDTWEYTPIPVPPPEPEPVIRYSKYKIQLACQKRNLWEAVKGAIANANLADSWANIVDIASDNPELQAALPDIRTAFGADTVEAVLAESVAD